MRRRTPNSWESMLISVFPFFVRSGTPARPKSPQGFHPHITSLSLIALIFVYHTFDSYITPRHDTALTKDHDAGETLKYEGQVGESDGEDGRKHIVFIYIKNKCETNKIL
jgi:hypothetical protein